jgi:hypothetical protein
MNGDKPRPYGTKGTSRNAPGADEACDHLHEVATVERGGREGQILASGGASSLARVPEVMASRIVLIQSR